MFENIFLKFKKKRSEEEIRKDFQTHFSDYTSGSKVNKMSIQVENLDKVYDNGVRALHNVSIDISPGEFIVLLGPSGCGKTTTLRMVAGLETITDGYIKFNQTKMNGITPKDRRIAMVFQNYALYPFMSVKKNISFGLKNKARSNNVYKAIVNDMKHAKNSNFDEIQAEYAKINLTKNTAGNLKDKILRQKRVLAITKINKKIEDSGANPTERDEKLRIIEMNNSKEQIAARALETKQKSNNAILKETEKLNQLKQDYFTRVKSPQVIDEIKQIKLNIKKLKQTKEKDLFKMKELAVMKRKIERLWYESIDFRVEDVSTMLGINMYINRKPSALSGGQRQRVALARAISKSSGLFLFDEPLSNLDAKLRAKMRGEIKELHTNLGSTSLYVTHDQIEAMSMADKVVVMNKGYIQQIATPMELVNKPLNLFVARFIGNTNVNVIKAKWESDTRVSIGQTILEIAKRDNDVIIDPKDTEDIVVAFRPEHVSTDAHLIEQATTNKFEGAIKSTELLGNQVLLTLATQQLGNVSIVVPTSTPHKIGEVIKFAVNADKIHVYNNKTGYNILEEFNKENEYAKKVWIEGYSERIKNRQIMIAQKQKFNIYQKTYYTIGSMFSDKIKAIWADKRSLAVNSDEYKAS